jgi:FKBP-type peptidyl-prolyl cis-trans isomerase FkpA
MIKKNNQTILLVLMAILMISLGSCDHTGKYEKEQNEKIQEFISKNSNLNFVLKPSGLYYLEVLKGSGPSPVTNDTAYVKYTGKFLDGTTFESNVGTRDTLIYLVGYLNIPGFDEGVTYMRVGGKAIFLIPSNLGYGNTGYYFPAYTPVLYDAELVKLVAGPGK